MQKSWTALAKYSEKVQMTQECNHVWRVLHTCGELPPYYIAWEGPTQTSFIKALRNSLMREVTGIPENLTSHCPRGATFDSNKCYHKTEYTSVNRMRNWQKSRSEVDVITTPGTKMTRLSWPQVSVTMANDVPGGKRNEQLVYTYVSRKKNQGVISKRLLSATWEQSSILKFH